MRKIDADEIKKKAAEILPDPNDLRRTLDLIDSMPDADKWIPFKVRSVKGNKKSPYPELDSTVEGLRPNDKQEVLISDGEYTWTDTYVENGEERYLYNGGSIRDGMAWMPLPEPYKKKDA